MDIKYNSNDDKLTYEDYLEFSRKWLIRCFKWLKDDGRFCLNIPLDKNKGGHQSVGADLTTIVKDIGFIWSGNFSIGVNMFFKIVEEAAKVVNKIPEYDVSVFEAHHNMKKDSPSGTAKMIADRVIENLKRKDKIVTDKFDRAPQKNELHVASMRCGKIPGTHTVTFDSDADTIELTHRARNREGFALGAVLAAEFISGKKGFFDINDLMKDIIGGKLNG